jgi:hypothetical protein
LHVLINERKIPNAVGDSADPATFDIPLGQQRHHLSCNEIEASRNLPDLQVWPQLPTAAVQQATLAP